MYITTKKFMINCQAKMGKCFTKYKTKVKILRKNYQNSDIVKKTSEVYVYIFSNFFILMTTKLTTKYD